MRISWSPFSDPDVQYWSLIFSVLSEFHYLLNGDVCVRMYQPHQQITFLICEFFASSASFSVFFCSLRQTHEDIKLAYAFIFNTNNFMQQHRTIVYIHLSIFLFISFRKVCRFESRNLADVICIVE